MNFKPFDRIVPGLGEIFPNLKWLEINDQEIKFIEAEDFANLEELVVLQLVGNPLKTLKKNVFDSNYIFGVVSLKVCQQKFSASSQNWRRLNYGTIS
jgi:Leucine-rich repeat (LRR) protein